MLSCGVAIHFRNKNLREIPVLTTSAMEECAEQMDAYPDENNS